MIKQKEKIYASFVLNYSDIGSQNFNTLEKWIESYFEYYEIILVNNTKQTHEEIKAQLNPCLKEIMILNLGESALTDQAIRAGIEFSKGDSVFVINTMYFNDFTSILETMYLKHMQGNDIVITGVKYSKLRHRLFLKFISKISKKNSSPNHDLLFVVSKRAVNAYTQIKSKILPLTVTLRSTGFSVFEFLHEAQIKKQSLLSKDEYTLYMMLFSDLLPRFAIWISVACFSISVSGILYAIFMNLAKNNIVEGWTTLFLLISFGLSGIFMILSIIVRYLSLMGKEVQASPSYSVKQISKL